MVTQHSPFQYSALEPGQIRLLYATIEGNTTTWTLKVVQLHSAEFDALSYSWGDLGYTYPLICNGYELRVHQNLHKALPYLARRPSSLSLWIDAVCINQSDNEEKFAQIRLMHSIYRQAAQIWVWLGHSQDDYGAEAIALLPQIAKEGREAGRLGWNHWPRPTPASRGLPSFSSPVWRIVCSIIGASWFGRLWIVQEAALAKHIRVLYGDDEIEWDVLREAAENASSIGLRYADANGQRLPRLFFNEVVFLVRDMIRDPTKSDKTVAQRLLPIITVTAPSQHCFEPRDRVLGILGLVPEGEVHQIGLDSDMGTVDLYAKLTHFLLSEVSSDTTGWWHLFRLANSRTKRPGLPSWCPDYHNLDGPDARLHAMEHTVSSNRVATHYRASAVYTPSLQTQDFRKLLVRGKAFDTVGQVLPEIPSMQQWVHGTDSVEEMKNMYLSLHAWDISTVASVMGQEIAELPEDPSSLRSTDNDRLVKISLDDYWRTLIGDLTDRRDYTLTYQTYRSFRNGLSGFAEVMNRLGIDFDSRSLLNECAFGGANDPELAEANEITQPMIGPGTACYSFVSDLITCLNGRQLFTTTAGRLGFGPLHMQPGDVVCVLNNSRTADVLRGVGRDDTPTYQVLGQAYVHGVMHGEVESMALQEQEFVLV